MEFMSRKIENAYFNGKHSEYVVVPYKNKNTSMIFALPKDANNDLLQAVSLKEVLMAPKSPKSDVILTLPKFKIE